MNPRGTNRTSDAEMPVLLPIPDPNREDLFVGVKVEVL
jgi:hypothetical protein